MCSKSCFFQFSIQLEIKMMNFIRIHSYIEQHLKKWITNKIFSQLFDNYIKIQTTFNLHCSSSSTSATAFSRKFINGPLMFSMFPLMVIAQKSVVTKQFPSKFIDNTDTCNPCIQIMELILEISYMRFSYSMIF